MTKIKDIIQDLEQIAPSPLQESYDHAGLLVGDTNEVVTGVMYCLDSTEEVIDDSISTLLKQAIQWLTEDSFRLGLASMGLFAFLLLLVWISLL